MACKESRAGGVFVLVLVLLLVGFELLVPDWCNAALAVLLMVSLKEEGGGGVGAIMGSTSDEAAAADDVDDAADAADTDDDDDDIGSGGSTPPAAVPTRPAAATPRNLRLVGEEYAKFSCGVVVVVVLEAIVMDDVLASSDWSEL